MRPAVGDNHLTRNVQYWPRKRLAVPGRSLWSQGGRQAGGQPLLLLDLLNLRSAEKRGESRFQ